MSVLDLAPTFTARRERLVGRLAVTDFHIETSYE